MKKVPSRLFSCPLPSSGDAVASDDEYERTEDCGLTSRSPISNPDKMTSTSSLHRSRFFLEHERSSATLCDVYEVRKEVLGKGGFGAIRGARLKHGKGAWDRVVKTVEHRSTKDRLQFKREVTALRTLDHPHVCRVYETFEESRCFHLVLEFIDGKDLFGYVFERLSNGQALGEGTSSSITFQMLQGLHYCHSQNIIHRDIKPENVMVQCDPERTQDGEHIKFIDFGLAADARVLAAMPKGTFCGTYAYVAPEVTSGKWAASAASDLWAVGLIVHVLLLGDLPCDEIRHGLTQIQINEPVVPALAKRLVRGLLSIDPQARLSAARREMTDDNSWTNSKRQICKQPSKASTSSSPRNSRPSWHSRPSTKSSVSVETNTVHSFLTFHRSVMLHKAVITAVAMQLLDSQQVHKIQEQFIAIDTDGNGRLSKTEFCNAVAEGAPRDIAVDVNTWVGMVFNSIDTDQSGEIEYSEFLAAALAECSARSSASIRAAFHVFDVDRNQKISAKEFARVLDMMPQAILECISQFDTNGDGEIDFEEFNGLISKKGIPTADTTPHEKRNRWKF